MANVNPTGAWMKGQRPGYANTAAVNALDGTQITMLQDMLRNLGFYTGPVDGQTVGLGLLGAIGYFQQAFGFGPTSATFTTQMWYALNYANGMVVNKQPMDLGVWNSLAGARQAGWSTLDPTTVSAVPPGGIGAPPGAIQQVGQTPAPPPPAPAQPPAVIPGSGVTPTNQGPLDFTNAYASMDQYLTNFGLGAGSEFDLRDWAHNWLTQPDYNEDVFLNALQQTDAFKTRFGALNDQRRANGLPMMSPAEILQYEQTVAGIMRMGGMPASFYDNWRDYQSIAAKGLSPDEVAARVDSYRIAAYNMPPEVRQVLAQWFGPNDQASLAAYFADPDKALPMLQRELAMAQVAGAGAIQGIGVNQATAGQLADLGVGYRDAQQGFQRLDQIRPVFAESVGERNDLTIEGEGIAATFGTAPGAQGQIEKRITSRQKQLQGGGQAAISNRGIIGAGRAV